MNGLLLLIARFWQFIAELSSRRQNGGSMRSAAFVRYGGANGMGHVGWAFDLSQSEVNAGAVENPLGTPTCDPATMGYWDDSSSTPMASMQQRAYNDLKFIALPKGEAEVEAAYRTAKWVGLQPYCAFGRNCLDDTYDVLRSYGVPNLPLPSRDLLPDKWFIDLDGQIEPVATYVWPTTPPTALQRIAAHLARSAVPPLEPTWRTPGHPDWHDFQSKLAAAAPGEGSMLKGVDVSADQGTIVWSTVKASRQVSFVYARVFHSRVQGNFGDDTAFATSHDGCKGAGIPFGAYFFYMAAQDGAAQADHFIQVAEGRYGDLAPMVDVEEGSGAQGWGDSVAARIANLEACLERITAKIAEPIVYTNQDTWHEFFGDSTALSKYRLWVADAPAPPSSPAHMPAGWSTWAIHQYAIGQIPGIHGSVDLDCLNSKGLALIRRDV